MSRKMAGLTPSGMKPAVQIASPECPAGIDACDGLQDRSDTKKQAADHGEVDHELPSAQDAEDWAPFAAVRPTGVRRRNDGH